MREQSAQRSDGILEGIARSVSQAAVFLLDTQKTRKQVYGSLDNAPAMAWGQILRNGMLTSMSTSGIVFGTYYTIYNSIGPAQWHAGPCAALATSMIKIPISNSIRLMQSGQVATPFAAARKLYRTQKWRGLYAGYGVSLLEDMIELDIRTRLYQFLRKHMILGAESSEVPRAIIGASIGAMAGSAIAWMTTPFDTIRSHMAISGGRENGFRVAHRVVKQRGVQGLYAGGILRASSSAVKSSLFFLCLETLQI